MKRIVTAALLIFIVVLLIFRGQPWMLTLASALIAELAAYEYLRLANTSGARIPAWWMLLGTAVVFLFTLPNFHNEAELPALSALALFLLAWTGFREPLDRVLPDARARPLRAGLCGVSADTHPDDLLPRRRQAVAALPAGLRLGGRHRRVLRWPPLGPAQLSRLSPNKTWEGTLASVGGSVLAGLAVVLAGEILSTYFGNTALHILEPVWQSAVLAVVINVAAQLGDLLESAIKRGAGVKN